jgi:hypothetical protein
MPGIGRLGKLFFKFFFERPAQGKPLPPKSKRDRQAAGKATSIDLPRARVGLAGDVASRQGNNLAQTVATVRRIGRAPAT